MRVLLLFFLFLVGAVLPPGAQAADEKEDSTANTTTNAAKIKVSGFGFLGNREMKRLLKNFRSNPDQPEFVDETFAEDSTLVLLARVNAEGYLNARLSARFFLPDGSQQRHTWTNALDVRLPQDFLAREARFRVRRGVRYHYKDLRIHGAQAIPERAARGYFISGDTLFDVRANRTYSPAALKSSMAALREALARLGYRDATVAASNLVTNTEKGDVSLDVHIVEGPRTMVRSLVVEIYGRGDPAPLVRRHSRPNVPLSPLWQQDLVRQLREDQWSRGFPDASAELITERRETNGPIVHLDLRGRVHTGPLVRVGEVRFEGEKRTHEAVLKSRVGLDPGDPLDRVAAETARQRLARLGVFDWVSVRFEEVNERTRHLIYELKEAKSTSLSLLAGYGSYEMLRGGLEYEHRNVLGLAHAVRVRGLQSFKATQGDLTYTVPELLFEDLNLFARGTGLRREEVSFTREEYGGAVGVHRRLQAIQTDFALRYDYEFLNAVEVESTSPDQIGVTEAQAAAFVLDLVRDRRDNPLTPRTGLKLMSNVELASEALGGNVSYQRVGLSGSYHRPVGGGRYVHLGLSHAMSFTAGGTRSDLPFNKRYFPGGESSIRGYQQGEASPIDANGKQLGAETFTLGNVEFEQYLTRTWSVVGFFDALGFAEDRNNYPFDEGLYSAGGGIRWRTIIGPVRLEYGHNLNPRPKDPAGTLHITIGFPF